MFKDGMKMKLIRDKLKLREEENYTELDGGLKENTQFKMEEFGNS